MTTLSDMGGSFHEFLESVDLRIDDLRGREAHGFRRLETVSGDGNHCDSLSIDFSLIDQLSRHTHGDPAGSFSKDAFGFCQQLNGVTNFLVRYILGRPAR